MIWSDESVLIKEKDEHQMSIFDCFGLDEDNTFTGLSQRGEKQRIEEGESHGAEAFIELLPDDQVDDLLALLHVNWWS